jgi:hypothetical protein
VQVLEHLKIRHLFDAVVTSEMVKNQKPAPDIFLEAARRIGVEPQFCRAYEDTDLGLQAIRSAGMEAVDVRPLWMYPIAIACGNTFVLKPSEKVPLTAIKIARVAGKGRPAQRRVEHRSRRTRSAWMRC